MTIDRGEFHDGSFAGALGARLVVAHRGASAAEPENTVAAFEAAIDAGADAIELDVRLTSDGIPVILHDADVAMTTNGSGFVHQMSLAEVKRLDAARGRDTRHEVPTLSEALATVGGRAAVNLEIKNLPGEPAFDSPTEAILDATLTVLTESGFTGPVLISSFNWLTIERSKQLAPELPTGFLSMVPVEPHAALVYVRHHGHDFVLPQTPALMHAGEGLVREAHEHGIRVGTWVANEPDILVSLFSWGVDAVACDDPAAAIAIRDRLAQ